MVEYDSTVVTGSKWSGKRGASSKPYYFDYSASPWSRGGTSTRRRSVRVEYNFMNPAAAEIGGAYAGGVN